jgi:hypothetical protein
MNQPRAHVKIRRPFMRGICLVVKTDQPARDSKPDVSLGTMAKFPRRPESDVVSESIPLFFIARNRVGLCVVREAEGRIGGIFLFKRSAVGFAEMNSAPRGCATMLLAERLELDLENRGNRLIGWIGATLKVVARYIPEYPPPIPIPPKRRKGKWQ